MRATAASRASTPSPRADRAKKTGTLDVRVRGAWLVPPTLFSRLAILCAILRHWHLLLAVTLTRELPALKPRAFVVDQLSAGLPLLQYSYEDVPLLFYCHFPDLLLARGRDASLLKRLYRVPFDWLEQWTMGFAHALAVNSEFTKRVVDSTWPGLTSRVPTRVVYPCVDVDAKEAEPAGNEADDILRDGSQIILSINRFERKKDIGLAIKAFAAIPAPERKAVRLVLAGIETQTHLFHDRRLTLHNQAATTPASPKMSNTTPSSSA